MENRSKFFLRTLVPTFIIFGLQTLCSIIVTEMAVAVEAKSFAGNSIADFFTEILSEKSVAVINQWTLVVYSLVAIVLFGAMYYMFFYNKNGKHYESVAPIEKSKELSAKFSGYKIIMLIMGVAILSVAMFMVNIYIISVIGILSPESMVEFAELQEMSGLTGEYASPWILIYAVVIGPIAEELAFRGLTMESAKRTSRFVGANIIQAVLFAGMHMNIAQAIYAFALGLIFGYIYHLSGNILITIIIHIIYNGIACALDSFEMAIDSNPIIFFVTLVISLCGAYAGIILIRKSLPDSSENSVNDFAEESDN